MNGTSKLDSIKQQPLTTTAKDESQKVQDQAKLEGRGVLDAVENTEIDDKKDDPHLQNRPTLQQPAENLEQSVFQDTVDKLNALVQTKAMVDIFAVMVEFYKAAMALSDVADQSAHAALDAQIQAINNQAEDIRSSATKAMWAGIVSGSMNIVGGLIQTAGPVVEGFAQGSKYEIVKKLFSDKWWEGPTNIVGSTGKIGESILNQYSQFDQADSKTQEANATKLGAERDEMKQFCDTMAGYMSSTLSTMQQIMQSRAQTVSKIFA